MAKTVFELDDGYFCKELEYIRKMHETRDYSGLMAAIERLQIHGNSMESALYSNKYKNAWDKLCWKDDDPETLFKQYEIIKKSLED